MDSGGKAISREQIGRFISVAIVAVAVILGLVVLYRINYYPRTDDAEVFANFIGIAPQVEGPLIRLNVHDNQFVKSGTLLYEIDRRPYEYALERALSEHGYELSKLIHARSGGKLTFHIDSLYPLLYRLEERGWIKGAWVEKSEERRRRFYRVTAEGRRVLAQQKKTWEAFVEAVRRVTGDEHARLG